MKKQAWKVWTSLSLASVTGLALWFAATPNRTVAAPPEGSITGVVTDDAGNPLRGAPVTAKLDNMSVSRFSDASGKYQISGLKPGSYSVSATAYGYGVQSMEKEVGGSSMDIAFHLKERWNPSVISTSDYISAFGDDKDMRNIEATCTGCHNLSWVMHRRGQTAEEWANFIPNMSPRNFFPTPRLSPDALKNISVSLEKYFGPDSPLPTKEQVHHAPISDEALNSTIHMYTPPTSSFAHSLNVGSDGRVWFTEFDNYSNKVGSFDPKTNEFHEYEMPSTKGGPHNPWVARNGMIWITEAMAHKLTVLDPNTGKMTEYVPPETAGIHTLREDSTGNIWTSGSKITRFDIETKKFTVYDTPSVYDVAVDYENNAWGTAGAKGALVKVDAKTGAVKLYPVLGGTTDMKGVEVDAENNIWFGDVTGHRLGKFDQKTEKMTFYAPPVPNFSVYGIVMDKKTAKIWTVNFKGSSVTRLDPATGKFTVFPLPSEIEVPRFFGEDPAGRIWFTDSITGRIGVLDTGESKMTSQK